MAEPLTHALAEVGFFSATGARSVQRFLTDIFTRADLVDREARATGAYPAQRRRRSAAHQALIRNAAGESRRSAVHCARTTLPTCTRARTETPATVRCGGAASEAHRHG